MLIIRRIPDDTMPMDSSTIVQVQEILRSQIPGLHEEEISSIPEQLKNPLKYRFRSTLFIAENHRGTVQGFALMLFAPDLKFCYLDLIASRKGITSGGIGGSLYENVRNEARKLGATGLFFECLPDDPAMVKNQAVLDQNMARLKFYERFGAFPIINTRYEKPVKQGQEEWAPYLLCDFLGAEQVLSRTSAKNIIRAILQRRYRGVVSPAYIQKVVASVKDDPVKIRKPRYVKRSKPGMGAPKDAPAMKILMLVNDKHSIHHVRDRGYVESPVRISSIKSELQASGLFQDIPVYKFPEQNIREVHDPKYISYFKRVCEKLPEGKSIYPYVFPVRNSTRAPSDDSVLAGYYCIDTFTPLNKNAFLAAKRAVDCTLTGAAKLAEGFRAVYALVRPPGHHAERRVFGGFCYFNSGAIAAHYLSRFGKVAMLDIDYHHGNGQQDIFYGRKDVLTISIHGHPSFAYPYFNGFADETGEGEGLGYNVNFPLKEVITGEEYRIVLLKAVLRIKKFKPDYLIVLLGLDTAKGDPTGTWSLSTGDFQLNGEIVAGITCPVLFVQEGGYKNNILGKNARSFFTGFHRKFFHNDKP